MINRPGYIAAIAPFIDQPLVKILAGVCLLYTSGAPRADLLWKMPNMYETGRKQPKYSTMRRKLL